MKDDNSDFEVMLPVYMYHCGLLNMNLHNWMGNMFTMQLFFVGDRSGE